MGGNRYERSMRISDFKVLTFDCYGTLIDWETGISRVLRRWADAEAHFREAVEIADATGGKRGSNALETRYGLARALSAQRKWPESVAVLAECEPLVSWTLAADAKWAVAYAEALLRSGRRDVLYGAFEWPVGAAGRQCRRAALRPVAGDRPD